MTVHEGKTRLETILAAMQYVTRGPWQVFDGCSWRRIGRGGHHQDDCAVLAPTKASDGHPDLTVSRGNDRDANLDHISKCDPETFDLIGDYVRGLETKVAEYEDIMRRLSALTPMAANARDAQDLHHTVKAIVDTALARQAETPAN